MSPYPQNCNVRGQKIVVAQNGRGDWQPLEPDGSGRHKHRSGSKSGYHPIRQLIIGTVNLNDPQEAVGS